MRLPLTAAGVAALVAATVALAVPSALADTNTIANPGFETGALSPWSCGPPGSVVSSPVHSGTYALAGAASNSDNAQCTQTVAVAANTSYTLSGYVDGAYVYIGVSGVVSASTWTPSTGGGYSQLSVTFNSGSATSLTVYVHGWYGQGTYYADDFVMNGPGGGPPSPSPSLSPSLSPSPAPSVSPPPASGAFRNPVYFMPLDNSPQDVTSALNASGLRYLNLAFVLDSGGCTPAWGGGPAHPVSGDSTVTGVVSAVRALGGDVAVSFGGYNGTELGATCGGVSGLAAAYQAVIDRYHLTRIDLDYEGDDLDANTAVRFGAIRALEDSARAAGRPLHVSLTIPMTTVGLPDTGKDEIRAAIAAGAA
ncbi:MAG TPA: carbohydrate binding domain-containing protein, partial [Rugosimonospora sp.]|nr:carbohydrate binding domain-containing protein [Rugosimonospora sp.]